MTVSKAMERVWEWRDAIHQETKDMTRAERIEYFRQARKRLEERTGRRLNLPSPRKKARRGEEP